MFIKDEIHTERMLGAAARLSVLCFLVYTLIWVLVKS